MPSGKVWRKIASKPVKLNQKEKEELHEIIYSFIEDSQKLKRAINRIRIRAGRIYLYHLYQPDGWNDPNRKFIKPLIDGKYMEAIFGRITIYDKNWKKCTADWERHNGKWLTLKEGTLEECLKFIEGHNWFG
jgi:LPS sulfotransferase NodH